MGSFTLYADFNRIDGGPTLTKQVGIYLNTQVTGDNGEIFDNANVTLVDGILSVQLPANDNAPGDFGYTVRRANGFTKTWRVPAQAPGATVKLTSFTATTPLPLPATGDAASQADLDALEGRVVVLEEGGGGGGGGVSDHGALTGLGDDDHPQYLTNARGDARYATPASVTSASTADRQRANHTGTQTSTTISDFTEAVEDAVAALLGRSTQVGITFTYDDATGTLAATATGGGSGGLDAEGARDAVNAQFVGTGLITVAVNDAADTVTFSTTATQNSTDAALRDRSTHTGTQPASSITGLGTAAPLNVAASGNAAAGEVVKGNDTRLANDLVTLDATPAVDNAATIQAAVNAAAASKTWVTLPGGTFTCGEVTIPTGARIRGNNTVLVPSSTANRSIFYAGIDVIDVVIDSITFKGTLAADAAKARTTTLGTVVGVMLNQTDSVIVRGCSFTDFGQSGLRITNSGGSSAAANARILAAGNVVSNCWFYNNFYGYMADLGGEYNTVTGCQAINNRYGAFVKGGNNVFSGCNFSSNFVGMQLDEQTNSGHGSATGCMFNHNTTAMLANGITLGFAFSGCQFFAGNVDLIGSTGIVITASEFGNTLALRFQGGGANRIANCHVVGSNVTVVHNYNSVADATILTEVFKADGTLLEPTQPQQAGATYTFALTDAAKMVESTGNTAATFTVPDNATVAFPVGSVIGLRQYGTGQVTVTAAAGVTIRARGGAVKTAGQYAELSLVKRATDEWVLTGDGVS